ncbi:ABC transporter, substrate-binding protein, QAT family [Lentilactobacillus kisonensis DSM 19906 = JCM 15041]|uniref:ABC transporter, substrate-binding protein, QAT family n=1 Tax=Lentilactobacillus kisonensis DSM 19906 = JCM 15041 TaxID=1423766 RepID=A0A0R1NR85_9LACO|nr:ABC transporter, substrate-binding protein, QAT family [Lentilactobacillus kisonensis DSM 19906 = JCM 15041]
MKKVANFMQTLDARKVALVQALGQHLEISFWALLIAVMIAIPLAIWVRRFPKIAQVILQLTGVLQTIPSLALLGLLIPLVGIGTVPAIIALVVYALLPIFQNTYVGLTEIDPSTEEAADAMGMSRSRKLLRVELPMAMPIIISGIRTSMVLIIGTATLAALIGAGGLGNFILLGIDRNNTSLILIGAISAALLAIMMSFLISILQKMKFKYVLILLSAIIVVGGGVAGYTTISQLNNKVVIAGKLGAEPEILINMYRDLIRDKDPRMDVELKPNFGKTSFLFSALKSNQINVYPEFTGTVLETLTHAKQTPKSPRAIYQLGKNQLAQQDRMTYLKPMAYNNTYGIAVKTSFAKRNKLRTIQDLQSVQGKLKAGMSMEFMDRSDGLKLVERRYHLKFPVKGMEPELRYRAIHDNQINVIDCYSTDSELRQYHLTVLKDNKHIFPTYQGAPLMTTKFAKKHPQIVTSLNKLAGKISEKQIQEMNYEVNVLEKSPASVAHHYLIKHHLIRE